MANEITTIASLEVTTVDGAVLTDKGQAVRHDQIGTHIFQNIQDIGFAAHEAIFLSTDLATPGWAKFTNLDITNSVQIGVVVTATFYPIIKLGPLDQVVFPLDPAATLNAKASVASCKLKISCAQA